MKIESEYKCDSISEDLKNMVEHTVENHFNKIEEKKTLQVRRKIEKYFACKNENFENVFKFHNSLRRHQKHECGKKISSQHLVLKSVSGKVTL